MAKLTVINPEFSQQSCELPDGKISVGRAGKNMLVVSDNSVSSQHCELLVDGPEVIVRELGSRNGTFVAGVRIQRQSAVGDGQILRLGKVDLRLDLAPPKDNDDDSNITSIYAIKDAKQQADRAHKSIADFHVTFTPIGDPIPESMTMFMPKVRDGSPAPDFSIPELKEPLHKKSYAVPVALAIGLGLLILALAKFFSSR